jgi:hypothetical protein
MSHVHIPSDEFFYLEMSHVHIPSDEFFYLEMSHVYNSSPVMNEFFYLEMSHVHIPRQGVSDFLPLVICQVSHQLQKNTINYLVYFPN